MSTSQDGTFYFGQKMKTFISIADATNPLSCQIKDEFALTSKGNFFAATSLTDSRFPELGQTLSPRQQLSPNSRGGRRNLHMSKINLNRAHSHSPDHRLLGSRQQKYRTPSPQKNLQIQAGKGSGAELRGAQLRTPKLRSRIRMYKTQRQRNGDLSSQQTIDEFYANKLDKINHKHRVRVRAKAKKTGIRKLLMEQLHQPATTDFFYIVFEYLQERYCNYKFVNKFKRFYKRMTLIQKCNSDYFVKKGSYKIILKQVFDKYFDPMVSYLQKREEKKKKLKELKQKKKGKLLFKNIIRKTLLAKPSKPDEEIIDQIIEVFMDCANRQYSVEWENYHNIKSNLEPFLRRMLALYAAVKNDEEQDILRIIPRQINIRKFLRNEKKAQKEAEVELKVPSRFKLPTFH